MLRILWIFPAALALAPVASAEIFKCTAKNGLDLYQNFPCEIDSLGSLPSAPTTETQPAIQAKSTPAAKPPIPPKSSTELRVGMTAAEVKTLWGEPAEIVQDEPASGRVEIWQYDDGRVVQINHKHRVVSVQR